jgi:predicted esterase
MGKGFDDLRRAMFRHYGAGRYPEALDAAREAWERFPEHEARTAYWVACLLCRVGNPDEALRVLAAARGRGRWWGERLLTADPDLEPLRGRPGFLRLIADCAQAHRAAQAAARPEVLIFPPEISPSRRHPLVLALQGRGGSAAEYAPHFRSATDQGWIVALPQGTQLEGEGMYTWDDPEQAERDIAWAYGEVAKTHRIAEDRMLLAGVSQGGGLAIALALRGRPIPCRGFAAVVPTATIGSPGAGTPLHMCVTPDAAQRGVRGWILTGDRDPRCPQVCDLHEKLVQIGIVCQLDVLPVGHEVPADFGTRLTKALTFLAGPPQR